MKYFIFIVFLFVSFFTFSEEQTYSGIGGASQLVADYITDTWSFFYSDVPDLIERSFAFFVVWAVKIKLFLYKEGLAFSWGIARAIIQDLQIMSQITAHISLLSPDVRQALVDMRFFDAINIVIHAVVTRFVMRF